VQFVYTIPTEASGLDAGGVHLLRNAVENHARVDVVNIMTFDYYDDRSNASAETIFGPCETFTTDDATTIAPQNDWQFSRIFEPVTQGRGHRL
jgi:hypothetical protein